MPKVSVIITTYNRCRLVTEAIDSVLKQTFKDFEIIVVDDGSTDSTGDIIQERYGPLIRYFYQPNQGCPPNNKGIQNSRGLYLAFLDSDDLWLPEKLQKQVAVLDAAPPEVGLVYVSAYIQDTPDKTPWIHPADFRGNGLKGHLLSQLMFSPSRVLLKRECIYKVGGFDETLKRSSDTDLWIRIAKYYDIECILEPLIIKRHFDFNIMKNPKHLDDPSKIFEQTFNDPEISEDVRALKGESYANRYLNYIDVYIASGQHLDAVSCFFKALRYYPKSIRKKHILKMIRFW